MNYLSDFTFISLLVLIKNKDFAEITKNPFFTLDFLKTLEYLQVISVLGSNPEINIELTSLGHSILHYEEMKNISKTVTDQYSSLNNKINSLSIDIDRIKTSISAISFDLIKSQGVTIQNDLLNSNFGVNKQINFEKNINNPEIDQNQKSKIVQSLSIEELKKYVSEIKQNLEPNQNKQQNIFLGRIKNNFITIQDLFENKKYQEFSFESFLLIDGILLFILKFFEPENKNYHDLTLESKYDLVRNLPLQLNLELVQFLDRINLDMQKNVLEPIKVGEKTASKIFTQIVAIHRVFIAIFDE